MKAPALVVALALAAALSSQTQPESSAVLNTGWLLRPAGRQLNLGSFPINAALSPDGKFLLAMNAGSISVVNVATSMELSQTPAPEAWLGLAFAPNGKFVYASGGSRACVYEFSFAADGKLALTRTFATVLDANRKPVDFTGDVAVSPDGRFVYATSPYQNAIHVINLQSGRVIEKFLTGRRPYGILIHPDGKSFFVSSWVDGAIYHHGATNGEKLESVRVGSHPTSMVWRARKAAETAEEQAKWAARIFVSASNTNNVYVVGVSESKQMQGIESINAAMTPRHPLGMTPSGLALSPDQDQLYVACSDANAMAVVDLTDIRSRVVGFIPTGWYPTAVKTLPNGQIAVLNGRGGSASLISPFTEEQLREHTRAALANSPYKDEMMDVKGSPVAIEHVLYIVKEGLSYDQILGDAGKGNSNPSLARYKENQTPNHHKLAKEFVLFDNFRVSGDTNVDGAQWASAAIANDYVQKLAGRIKLEENDPATLPPAGYLWSNAAAAGITMRNYGWRVTNAAKPAEGAPQIEGVRDNILARSTATGFRGLDPEHSDVDRAKAFLKELAGFEKDSNMPKLLLMRLGNDARPGTVADNDQALGLIVEGVSKSKFWASTAIFVVESFAGSPDHVSPYRAPAFVLSPFTRRGAVDNNMYNSASVLRTIELLVGLRPMNHFDAGARPMFAAFATPPDTRPYVAEAPRN